MQSFKTILFDFWSYIFGQNVANRIIKIQECRVFVLYSLLLLNVPYFYLKFQNHFLIFFSHSQEKRNSAKGDHSKTSLCKIIIFDTALNVLCRFVMFQDNSIDTFEVMFQTKTKRDEGK